MLKKILNNNVFKNFSYLTIGTVLSQGLSLVTILKITSVLTPGQYGVFSFLMVQGTLLLTLGDLGVRNIIVRTIARDPFRTNDLVYNGAIIRSLALVLLIILYVIYNTLWGNLNSEQLTLVAVFSFINCFSNLFENVFLGYQKMLPSTLINLSYSIIWFIAVYLLPLGQIDVNHLFYIFLVINAIRTAFFFIILKYKNLLVGKVANFLISSKKLFRESWPYFVLVILMLPFSMLSNNFLDINSTIEQIGYFNLSQKLIGPVSLVIDIGLAAIFPNLSSLWVKDEGKFARFISIGFKYFMLFSLILCFLFTLFASDGVNLLFSPKYLPAVKISQLLIWYLFLASIDSLMGTILGAVNKEKIILRFGILKALFCTPFLYFGSKYGALGLAVGYIVPMALFQIYLWYAFRQAVVIKVKDINALWILSVLLFSISYYFGQSGNYLVLRILLAVGVLSFATIYGYKNYKRAILK